MKFPLFARRAAEAQAALLALDKAAAEIPGLGLDLRGVCDRLGNLVARAKIARSPEIVRDKGVLPHLLNRSLESAENSLPTEVAKLEKPKERDDVAVLTKDVTELTSALNNKVKLEKITLSPEAREIIRLYAQVSGRVGGLSTSPRKQKQSRKMMLKINREKWGAKPLRGRSRKR